MPSGILEVLFLAVIQGLTEFLPVSSSGHLVIAEALLKTGGPRAGGVIFEVAVHVGTLGAVVAVYRRKIMSICLAVALWLVSGCREKERFGEDLPYAGWIILGTIPAAVIGLLFHDRISDLFGSPALVSIFLSITGIYLWLSKDRGGSSSFGWKTVLLIGAAQAVAILPGFSRSGWTITTALLLGIGFARAAEFSFLLSIPAILGALVLELAKGGVSFSAGEVAFLVTGAAAAFFSGLFALKLLIYLLGRGRLYRFSYYMVPGGVLFFIFFSLSR